MITINLMTNDTNLLGRLISEYGTETVRAARRVMRSMNQTNVPWQISVR